MKLIVANWKMNPLTVTEAARLARAEDKRGVVIAPPAPFLAGVHDVLVRAKLGAQDVFFEMKGAYTGAVAPAMLTSLGVRYVIIGHSERRAQGESDAMVKKKVQLALAKHLTVILCVGEPWSVRKKGMAAAKRFIARQLRMALKGVIRSPLRTARLIIAYEPVWAIGTGKADHPLAAAAIATFIKKLLATRYVLHTARVLYGGSVTPHNAAAFLREKSIDGALVGGASLRPRDFMKIITAAHVPHR